jgi:hypothetical protein
MEFYPGFEKQEKRKYTKHNTEDKYPNGFLPKIQYWNEQFGIKITEGKLDDAQQCLNKMNYFIIRQKELITKK